MNRILIQNRNVVSFGIPLVLFGALIYIMKSSFLPGNDILNFAISVDLLVTVPLVYFLLVRKTTIPKTTVIPVIVVGLLLGTHFLLQDGQTYLNLFKTWALPVIEISILTFIVFKVRRAIKKYKRFQGLTPDFFTALKNICYEILPKKLVIPFATEVAVIYYGFINWKNRTINKNEFTYHKKSGTPALIGAIIFLIGIETFVFHLLLSKWSLTAAWIFSGISIYTAIQMFGFARSLSNRPISINEKYLSLRYGILTEVDITLSDIESIELSKKPIEQGGLTKKLSPFGELESHNVIITLKEENTLTGIYGIKKKFKAIGLHIDEPTEFKEKINNALQSSRRLTVK